MRNAYVGLGYGHPRNHPESDQVFVLQCAAQISHLKAFCENPESQIFAKRSETLGCCTRFALSWCLRLKAKRFRYCELTANKLIEQFDLSPRETEVLGWVAQGKSNSVIADILELSPHTVDTLIRRIFDKLAVNDRTSAALLGVGSGLMRPV